MSPLALCLAWSALVTQGVQLGKGPPHGELEPFTPDLVAGMRVRIPSADEFILRGTLPLPAGTYLPGEASKLALIDHDGRLLPTQVEVVSRYPDAIDGADVVELLARVRRKHSWLPGSKFTYKVTRLTQGGAQLDPGTPDFGDLVDGPIGVPDSIAGLLIDPDALLVVATDPLGNRYVARPLRGNGGLRTERHGVAAATLRSYETTFPEFPPLGTSYPHMMGVHAYVTSFAGEEVLSIDLRFNNGSDNFDPNSNLDDLLGKIYFNQLEVYLPEDATDWWMRAEFSDPSGFDPALDTPVVTSFEGRTYRAYPLVKPLPLNGSTQPAHMLPCKSQFIRRLVVAPVSNRTRAGDVLAGAGRAFAADATLPGGVKSWSWHNPATARYFPQRQVLPTMSWTNGQYGGLADLLGQLNVWLGSLSGALALNGPLVTPHDDGAASMLGWDRPLGSPSGGAGGGDGIQSIEGDRAVAATHVGGYQYLELCHRLHLARMPNVVWDAAGDPTFQDRWLAPCPGPSCPSSSFPSGPGGVPSYTTIEYNMNLGKADPDFCPSPAWIQNLHVVSFGKQPDYETNPTNTLNINKFAPHDMAHLTRYTRFPLALSWLGNDPLAKDDVRATAEMFRFTHTEYGNAAGNGTSESLHADLKFVLSKPGWGYNTGRGDAWGIQIAAGANALSDDAFRARMRPWFDRLVEVLDLGMAHATDASFVDPSTGQPYPWGFLSGSQNSKFFGTGPNDPRGRQTWEEMLLQNALLSLLRSVYSPADGEYADLDVIYRESLYGIAGPIAWSESGRYIHETVPVSAPSYTPPPGNVYDCDPTASSCSGQNPIPLGAYAPWGRDDHYSWPALAQGHVVTGDPLFLARAGATLSGNACPLNCAQAIEGFIYANEDPTNPTEYSTWSNLAGLLGVVQND